MKLGKLPPKIDPRTLFLAKYLKTAGLPTPPPAEDFGSRVGKNWGMMLNDQIGDCTCAAAGHMLLEWTTYAGKPFTPSDTDVLTAYSAVSGYNPQTGANDNGAVLLDVLNYWRQTGIAGHKIIAYVALEPKNHNNFEDALYLFGNVYLGLALPMSAQNQQTWTVPPGGPVGPGAPGSWGGHAVPVVGYNRRGLTVVTWGKTLAMSWTFLDTYCDEAFAVLSQDWFKGSSNLTPDNFDMATLQQDLSLLSGGRAPAAVNGPGHAATRKEKAKKPVGKH
jgi:hypothetical protein